MRAYARSPHTTRSLPSSIDSEQRNRLSELGMEEAGESPVFARVAELGEEFEAGLLSLLFDDRDLRRWVREYIVF